MEFPARDAIVEFFAQAIDGGYAIPHINHSDYGDLVAIAEAGREARTPIIAAGTLMTTQAMGFKKISAVAHLLAEEGDTPFILHCDHCPSPKLCKEAVDAGYNSIMIDASDKPLPENIAIVKDVVEYAHARGVFVEAEVGHVAHGDGDSWDASVDEAVQLVEATGADALAVAIGSEHGFYKEPPKLNYELLSQVSAALPRVPLVLHGGSGIPADDVKRAVACGIRKVNVGTDVRCTYVAGLRDGIAQMGIERHTADIIAFARERAKEKIFDVIEMCGSRGTA